MKVVNPGRHKIEYLHYRTLNGQRKASA